MKQCGFFSLPELKYKQQRQKQMNSVNISSIKILGIMSAFLIPLLKFWGYLAMWHFMTFFLLLLYTVNNIFQDVVQLPPLWFTQHRITKAESVCKVYYVHNHFLPRFVLRFGGRFISEIMMVFVLSLGFSLLLLSFHRHLGAPSEKQLQRDTVSWFLIQLYWSND